MVQLDENKVWIDGCFDFTHHGHAGAILQARRTILPKDSSKGELYCGVHNDEAITFNKGKPVMNSAERYEHTRSSRWCSHVVEDAPYVTEPDVLDQYSCKYVVHGDDITLDANGEDCYQEMKDLGRFRVVKRTSDVSTTDIIHRMLTGIYEYDDELPHIETMKLYGTAQDGFTKYCWVYDENMSNVLVEGQVFEGSCNIIVMGDFDLFHMGHIEKLSKVKHELYPQCNLIVGLKRADKDGKKTIMSLTERLLSAMSCKYVDGIIIEPTTDLKGKTIDIDSAELAEDGQFSYLTKQVIVDRIEDSRDIYIKRNVKKGMRYE